MAKRGPKPKPTAILRLLGSPAANKRSEEPQEALLSEVPAPPAGLEVTGRERWQETCEVLRGLGLLQRRFLPMIELLAVAWDQKEAAVATLKAEGEYVKGRFAPVRHPASKVLREALDAIRRISTELGLSPSASANVAAAAVREKSPGIERYRLSRDREAGA